MKNKTNPKIEDLEHQKYILIVQLGKECLTWHNANPMYVEELPGTMKKLIHKINVISDKIDKIDRKLTVGQKAVQDAFNQVADEDLFRILDQLEKN